MGVFNSTKKSDGKLRDGLENWDDFIQIYLCGTCLEVSTVWANKILGKVLNQAIGSAPPNRYYFHLLSILYRYHIKMAEHHGIV